MKQANIELKLRPGFVVPMYQVTPAEVQLLCAMHGRNAKENPVTIVAVLDDVERDELDEWERLNYKYPPKKVQKMYPKTSFRFPETFDRAIRVGTDTQLPQERFQNSSEAPALPLKGDE